MSTSDDDDDASSSSTHAVVFNHSIVKDQSDVLSVRSMPLEQDDDYFYYRGDVGQVDDEDDETVDHIGLLIGPATAQKKSSHDEEREMRSSARSVTSEVTSDWCDFDFDPQEQDEPQYTTRDCVELKLQIANLKAQLDDQKLHYKEIISSLKDHNKSLESENIALKQRLKISGNLASSEKKEASLPQGKDFCPEKVHMARDVRPGFRRHSSSETEGESPSPPPRRLTSTSNPAMLVDTQRRRPSFLGSLCHSFQKTGTDNTAVPMTSSQEVSAEDSDSSNECHSPVKSSPNKNGNRPGYRRHSSSDTEGTSNREEEYLPFPDRPPRRLSSSGNPSLLAVAQCRRASLIESLRHPFRKNSNETVPNMASSQVSSQDSDNDNSDECHCSWSCANEINAQTEIFNSRSITKLLEDYSEKTEPPIHEPARATRRNSIVCPSQSQPEPTFNRPKVQRRKSFTFGERPPSLRNLLHSGREEEIIDVESELWDCFV